MKCCKDCKHFTDGHFSKTYISPRCTLRGDDDCSHMRQNVCGVDAAIYYQPKNDHMDAQSVAIPRAHSD